MEDDEAAQPLSELTVLAGGDTTIFSVTNVAFSTPAPNLDAQTLAQHLDGDMGFEASFVSAGNEVNPGLGPVFNTSSCIGCHAGDGRGKPPDQGADPSLLIRLSIPGSSAQGGPNPVPDFGGQLQDDAIFGVAAEASKQLSYEYISGSYADGTPFELRKPTYTLANPYAELPLDIMLSPRVAPPVFGLGLLEALDESTILTLADEDDLDGDGISGKPNYAHDAEAGELRLGRFGWKANTPNLRQQVAAAYNQDMGVTSPLFPVESCVGQAQDDGEADDPEIDDDTLDTTTVYVQTLAVPARRNTNSANVRLGEQLFTKIACASCHVPSLTTGSSHPIAALHHQQIHAFTDLLLHDMGEGLADNRPDFAASGSEWRTPPLWGLGLTAVVSGHTFFLHDGRARNLEEAILWHGGEAQAAKESFQALSAGQRAALLAFLESN